MYVFSYSCNSLGGVQSEGILKTADGANMKLQLVNFIQWSEFSKFLGRALKVFAVIYFSCQELLFKKISGFESTEKQRKPS